MTNKRPFSYSYSLINSYISCPYRMYREKVVKDIPFVQNEAAKWGSECHDVMDKCIKASTLPEGRYSFMVPALSSVYRAANGSQVYSEHGYGLTEDLQPTTFRAGYLKGKLDVKFNTNPEKVTVVDWKVAKYDASKYQLETDTFSYLVLKSEPEVKEVKSVLVWLKEESKGPPTVDVKTRADIPELEDKLLGKIATIERSLEYDNFPPKPSGLCGFCPVKDCKFWREPRRK